MVCGTTGMVDKAKAPGLFEDFNFFEVLLVTHILLDNWLCESTKIGPVGGSMLMLLVILLLLLLADAKSSCCNV